MRGTLNSGTLIRNRATAEVPVSSSFFLFVAVSLVISPTYISSYAQDVSLHSFLWTRHHTAVIVVIWFDGHAG